VWWDTDQKWQQENMSKPKNLWGFQIKQHIGADNGQADEGQWRKLPI